MLALLDYGLIVVFFLGVLLFVLLFAHPQADEAAKQKNGVPHAMALMEKE